MYREGAAPVRRDEREDSRRKAPRTDRFDEGLGIGPVAEKLSVLIKLIVELEGLCRVNIGSQSRSHPGTSGALAAPATSVTK